MAAGPPNQRTSARSGSPVAKTFLTILAADVLSHAIPGRAVVSHAVPVASGPGTGAFGASSAERGAVTMSARGTRSAWNQIRGGGLDERKGIKGEGSSTCQHTL